MSDYEQELAAMRKRDAARDSNLRAVLGGGRALTQREAETGKSTIDFDDQDTNKMWGEITADNEDVSIDLHSLPVRLAVAIMDLVHKEAAK